MTNNVKNAYLDAILERIKGVREELEFLEELCQHVISETPAPSYEVGEEDTPQNISLG